MKVPVWGWVLTGSLAVAGCTSPPPPPSVDEQFAEWVRDNAPSYAGGDTLVVDKAKTACGDIDATGDVGRAVTRAIGSKEWVRDELAFASKFVEQSIKVYCPQHEDKLEGRTTGR